MPTKLTTQPNEKTLARVLTFIQRGSGAITSAMIVEDSKLSSQTVMDSFAKLKEYGLVESKPAAMRVYLSVTNEFWAMWELFRGTRLTKACQIIQACRAKALESETN